MTHSTPARSFLNWTQLKAALSLVVALSCQKLDAASIVKGPAFRVSGSHTFTAVPTVAGAAVRWWVDRTEINEKTGELVRFFKVDSAIGTQVTFSLEKKHGRHTYYHVFAEENGTTDSTTVRVFLSNTIFTLLYEGLNNKGKPIPLFIVVPSGQSMSTRIVFVMHGTNRNADEYIIPWRDFAIHNDFIAIAPEFSTTYWPSRRSYHQGNMFTHNDGEGSLIPEPQWAFSLIQEIHDWLREQFGLTATHYDIWGHSAGAQFVHRMLLFKPKATIRVAIAANAGTYTVPDSTIMYPWGTKHSLLNIGSAELLAYTERNLVIHRGTADTSSTDPTLPNSPMDATQGRNRYERAGYFYNKGLAINSRLAWRLIDVPGVGHSHSRMAPYAQAILASSFGSVRKTETESTSNSIKLHQNFPNPFNTSTTIFFELPRRLPITLRVFDLLGRHIQVLINGELSAGIHKKTIDATELPSGVYFYELSASGFRSVSKMVLVK